MELDVILKTVLVVLEALLFVWVIVKIQYHRMLLKELKDRPLFNKDGAEALFNDKIGKLFGYNFDGTYYEVSWDSYIEKDSKLREMLITIIEEKTKHFNNSLKHIDSEVFVDEIVNRINRKQLNNG